MKTTGSLAAAVLLTGVLALRAAAQTITNPARQETQVRAELRELAASPTAADHDRAEVERFLANDRARDVAADMGIDLQALQDRVATLSDADAADLASRVKNANEAPMAGGDTFVITSTTIIIVLLIIILIIVA